MRYDSGMWKVRSKFSIYFCKKKYKGGTFEIYLNYV